MPGAPAAPGRQRRALLIDWGAWGDRRTADGDPARAWRGGDIDYYVIKPWRSPDELFHRTVTEFLHEWSRARDPGPARDRASSGARGPPRSHELPDAC